MYTRTVDLKNTETTQNEDDGTGECNPGLRAETRKIFEENKSKTEQDEDNSGPKERSRTRSGPRSRSRSRGRHEKYRHHYRESNLDTIQHLVKDLCKSI